MRVVFLLVVLVVLGVGRIFIQKKIDFSDVFDFIGSICVHYSTSSLFFTIRLRGFLVGLCGFETHQQIDIQITHSKDRATSICQ